MPSLIYQLLTKQVAGLCDTWVGSSTVLEVFADAFDKVDSDDIWGLVHSEMLESW